MKRYDFPGLIQVSPGLKAHIIKNKVGEDSIDFDNPDSVRALNAAILAFEYGIKDWNFPPQFLCPPIPSRADYIHHIKELFPATKHLRGLDIGVGASCIYPLIGVMAYGMDFVGAEVNPDALRSAKHIIMANQLEKKIEIRLQKHRDQIFKDIIGPEEHFDFTVCNPPFHSSKEEAREASNRKRRNLGFKDSNKLNFGGSSDELLCEGGEKQFVFKMIEESSLYKSQATWFSTLVSKEVNLASFEKKLALVKCSDFKIIPMLHGQKKSRILAWHF